MIIFELTFIREARRTLYEKEYPMYCIVNKDLHLVAAYKNRDDAVKNKNFLQEVERCEGNKYFIVYLDKT